MTWPIGSRVEYLGGCYEASVGLAVAAVWESPIYFNRVEDCHALKFSLAFPVWLHAVWKGGFDWLSSRTVRYQCITNWVISLSLSYGS